MRAADRGHRPGKAPAVDVEHRQRPQIDGIAVEAMVDDLAQGVEVGSAMVIQRTLRLAGRPGRVVQRDRLELVVRPAKSGRRRRRAEAALRRSASPTRSPPSAYTSSISITSGRDFRFARASLATWLNCRSTRNAFALGMLEDEGNGSGIEARVECIQHCPDIGTPKCASSIAGVFGRENCHASAPCRRRFASTPKPAACNADHARARCI